MGLFAIAAAAADPYKPEYRLSVGVGGSYPWGKGADVWAALIRERTAGRIVVRVFPGYAAMAGDAMRELPALHDGSVDLAVGSALNWSASIKPLNLFALPFLFSDARSVDAVIHGKAGDALMKAVAEYGIVPLAWGDNALHDVSTASVSLREPGAYEGLKLRTNGHPATGETLAALGAQPVVAKWLDAQRSLQDGALDGQVVTLPVYVTTKSQTLGQRRVTRLGLAAEPLVFAVSAAAWGAWSEADRELVRQAALDAARQETELAHGATAAAETVVGRDLRGAGVTLDVTNAGERERLTAAVRPVIDKWEAIAGKDLADAARAAVAASSRP